MAVHTTARAVLVNTQLPSPLKTHTCRHACTHATCTLSWVTVLLLVAQLAGAKAVWSLNDSQWKPAFQEEMECNATKFYSPRRKSTATSKCTHKWYSPVIIPVEIVAHLFRLPMYTMLTANIHEGKVDAGQQWRNVTLVALACHSLYHFSQCKVTQVWVRVPCPWTEVGHYMWLTQLYIQWFNDHCLPGTHGHPPAQGSLPTRHTDTGSIIITYHLVPGTLAHPLVPLSLPTRHTGTSTCSIIITHQVHRDGHLFNDHYLPGTQGMCYLLQFILNFGRLCNYLQCRVDQVGEGVGLKNYYTQHQVHNNNWK